MPVVHWLRCLCTPLRKWAELEVCLPTEIQVLIRDGLSCTCRLSGPLSVVTPFGGGKGKGTANDGQRGAVRVGVESKVPPVTALGGSPYRAGQERLTQLKGNLTAGSLIPF